MLRCPICEQPFDPATTPAMPFCSNRCRQIDLGRWLREVYAVPVERDPEEVAEETWRNGTGSNSEEKSG